MTSTMTKPDGAAPAAPAAPLQSPPAGPKPKREKHDVHGWVVLDKPVGMTSTHAVAVIKRLFTAKRAGHAGTLDPLASGCLPIALGEATKTVPFVMDGRKAYSFTVRWGEERDTDDAEGRVVATSDARPAAEAIAAALPAFVGAIEQVPPRYSAIKIDGERAYDIARDGEEFELKPRDRSTSSGSRSKRWSTPTTARFAPNAARAPMSARSRATSAGCSAAAATCRRCGAPRSARSRKAT